MNALVILGQMTFLAGIAMLAPLHVGEPILVDPFDSRRTIDNGDLGGAGGIALIVKPLPLPLRLTDGVIGPRRRLISIGAAIRSGVEIVVQVFEDDVEAVALAVLVGQFLLQNVELTGSYSGEIKFAKWSVNRLPTQRMNTRAAMG